MTWWGVPTEPAPKRRRFWMARIAPKDTHFRRGRRARYSAVAEVFNSKKAPRR